VTPRCLAYELAAHLAELKGEPPVGEVDVELMGLALERALPASLAERVALIREVTRA
jgi:hypothetical protein